MRARALLVLTLLVGTGLAGCLGGPEASLDVTGDLFTESMPGPGASAYDRSGDWSATLEPGTYDVLPVELVDVASADGTMLSAGVWRPDVPDGVLVPVVIDVSPYYLSNDNPVDERSVRLGGFLIDTLVPHGYAVVQASIRGSGWSGGCAELGGTGEQEDVDAFVTFFGEQDWSNGNVGLIGRSYDGTTAFEGAMFGNPHLRTIVPIAGISDWWELYYHNGSAEVRSPILGTLFTAFGTTSAEGTLAQACPDTAEHPVFGTHGWINGGGNVVAADLPYWTERAYQQRILDNYNGSLWIIQGYQDWNVEPHMAFPFSEQLRDKGLDVKVWAGQWQHAYPDRPAEHDHLRWDWAEALLHWFDRHLKDLDVDTGPVVETEDNHGQWRASHAWPADNTTWQTLYLSGDGELTEEPGGDGLAALYDPAAIAPVVGEAYPTGAVTFTASAADIDRRMAGLPRLHVTAIPASNGGQLHANLYVNEDGQRILVGHANMDLRYHAGGTEQQAVAPGVPVVARMEFYPLDVFVPAGATLEVELGQPHATDALAVGQDPLPSVHQTPVVVQWGGGSSLFHVPWAPPGGVFHVSEGVDRASTWG